MTASLSIISSIREHYPAVHLTESAIMPDNSLLLVGSSIHTTNTGMIGIIDLTGEFESWMFDDAIITEIVGSKKALDHSKEAVK